MQCFRRCLQTVLTSTSYNKNLTKLTAPGASFHTTSLKKTAVEEEEEEKEGPPNWLTYNDKIYPPQKPGEEPRPAVSLKKNSKIIVKCLNPFLDVN